MQYSKIKSGQIVLVEHYAKTGKDSGKLIDVYVGEVKSKVRGSKDLVRIKNVNKGLGYNPETRSYIGCQVNQGWFLGKPISHEGEELEDYDQYHVNDITLLDDIIKASKKQHKIPEAMKPNRVYIYRPLAYSLSKNCQVEMVCINTQDPSINGILVRFNSIDRKHTSPWLWLSAFYDLKNVESFLEQQKQDFLQKTENKKVTNRKK